MPRILPVLASLLPLVLHAGDKPKTFLATCGESLFVDALDKVPAPPAWTAAKGEWLVAEGAWKARERSEDNHGAVARHAIPLSDFVIRYEVKLDGAKGTSLSINAPKGHLARVAVSPAGMQVRKDDIDHDGPDKAQAFPVRKVTLAPGTWHTVVLEMCGDTMVASLDGEVVGYGAHASFNGAKANFGLTVAGECAAFRNVEVWSASPAAGWAETRRALDPQLSAPAPAAKAKAKATPKSTS